MRDKLLKGEIAKLFNTTKAAIRYYENKEVLSSEQDINGYKLYDWKDVQSIEDIIFLKSLGVSLEEVKKYQENKNDVINLLENKKNDLDEEIKKLIETRNRINHILSLSKESSIPIDEIYISELEARKYFILKDCKYYSLKEFYDSVSDFYYKIDSSKREFVLFHDNFNRNDYSFENSKMLIPYNEDIESDKLNEVILQSGKYISINYIYKDIVDFKSAYSKVLKFARENDLNIDETSFLEREIKDYVILYKDKLYELQFKILC